MSWQQLDPHIQQTAMEELTPRQLEILRHRINGHSWRTIADALSIDEATARGHYRRALRRLNERKDAA